MTWWDGRMACLDFETTSPEPEVARIVTAALAVVGGGLATETLTLLADPGIEIPAEAAEIHGITTEKARAEGLPAKEVVTAIILALAPHIAAGTPVVVFNARYDLTVLDREAARYEIEIPWSWDDVRVLDPLVIDKHIDRYRPGSRKLIAICEHYRAPLDMAHDAAFDAIAAGRVTWVIGKKGQVIRRAWNPQMERERHDLIMEWDRIRGDLAALFEAQRRWAREQAIGLAVHFQDHGQHDDAENVRVEWPVVPDK